MHRAPGAEPTLTDKFPFADRDSAAPDRFALTLVALEGAKGTLTCGGRTEPIAGEDLSWNAGAWSVSALRIERDGLAVTVESPTRPDRPPSAPSCPSWRRPSPP